MTVRTGRFITLFLLTGLAAACEAVKSANPLSPSVAGPIPGVEISAPTLLEPGSGWELNNANQPVRLLIESSSTTGQRPLTHTFELASDAQFGTMLFSRGGIGPGDGGRTSVQLSDRLPTGRSYFWRARAEDGANTGPYSAAVSFSIITPVVIDVPATRAPVGAISSNKPTFKIGNAPRSGPVGQIVDSVHVANDPGFGSLIAIYNVPEQAGETTFSPTLELPYSQTFYWRVRAYDSGPSGVVGAWSGAQAFSTPAPPPPPPTPTPSPSPSPGGSCTSSSPLSIVQCERRKYGHMSSSQTVAFLRAVARDLNTNGVAEGPFGILRKRSGSNCGGYSCDIICAGQGNAQKQWDVLSDAEGSQNPMWSGPKTEPNIRSDVCEIQ